MIQHLFATQLALCTSLSRLLVASADHGAGQGESIEGANVN
jgi:hypothetical protein